MRSNPIYIGTSLQLSAEIYHQCRNLGVKCILKYTDSNNSDLKANLVVCDDEWNIKAVGIYGIADKPSLWDSHDIPVVRFHNWEDAESTAATLADLVNAD